jgi:hypothetical protein
MPIYVSLTVRLDRTAGTRWHGQVSWDIVQLGQVSLDRTAWMYSLGRVALTVQPGQISLDRAAWTGQVGQISSDRSA